MSLKGEYPQKRG